MSSEELRKFSEWYAWYDTQPVGPPTLYVTAKCEFQTPGHSVVLKPVEPGGFNPKIRRLEPVVSSDPNQKTKSVDIKYAEETKTEYTHVYIEPNGPEVEVKPVS